MQRVNVQLLRQRPAAIARCMSSNAASRLSGIVSFYPALCGSLVVAEFFCLPEQNHFYALHIHQGTDCGGDHFADSMGHLNFTDQPHPNHTGDLPVILSGNGYAWAANYTARFTPQMILGYTVILHAQPDDYHSQPSGDSGEKIACGVIQQI